MEKVFNRKDNPLISVVVPIYKVEKYLEKCINSLLNQTYENIEIILVDDGSPDSCPKICDNYKEKDYRIKVIHQKNGGLSNARNSGLDIAQGKYVTFIDSDDYVSNDYIEYLYNLIKKDNTLISICGHYICFDTKTINKTATNSRKVDKETALNYILYDKEIDLCSWGKLYDINLFKKIRFPDGKIFEDTATTYLLFEECDYVSVGKESKYYYMIRDDSITTVNFNLKKMDLIYMTENMTNYILKKYPNLKDGCQRRLMWAYMSTYTKIVYTNKNEFVKEKKYIKDYISQNKKEVLKNKKISKRDKISLIIYSLGDSAFKLAWAAYKKIFN